MLAPWKALCCKPDSQSRLPMLFTGGTSGRCLGCGRHENVRGFVIRVTETAVCVAIRPGTFARGRARAGTMPGTSQAPEPHAKCFSVCLPVLEMLPRPSHMLDECPPLRYTPSPWLFEIASGYIARMASDAQSSCFRFSRAGITGLYRYS